MYSYNRSTCIVGIYPCMLWRIYSYASPLLFLWLLQSAYCNKDQLCYWCGHDGICLPASGPYPGLSPSPFCPPPVSLLDGDSYMHVWTSFSMLAHSHSYERPPIPFYWSLFLIDYFQAFHSFLFQLSDCIIYIYIYSSPTPSFPSVLSLSFRYENVSHALWNC